MKFEVVGIDSPCVDLAVNVDTYPDSNGAEKIQNISWQGGGKVATGIAAAARLGAKGAVIGTVGDDSYGRFVEDVRLFIVLSSPWHSVISSIKEVSQNHQNR